MEKRISKRVLANALGFTGVVYWVFNFLAYLLLPGPFPGVNRDIFLTPIGINPSVFNSTSLFLAFIFGGIVVVLIAWIFGYILGWSIDYFGKKEEERLAHEKTVRGAGTRVQTA